MKETRTIGIITTYPNQGEKHSEFSGLSGYVKNLLTSFSDIQRDSVVVFSNIKNSKRVFNEQNIEVNECWTRGNLRFVSEIIEATRLHPNLKIVHIHHEFNAFGGPISIPLFLFLLWRLKWKKLKIVVSYHGVISLDIVDREFIKTNQLPLPTFIARFMFWFIYRISAFSIDRAIVHEDCFKQILTRQYGFSFDQVSVVHHGVEANVEMVDREDARKQMVIGIDKKVVLYFGFLAGYKGIELLLDTFEQLKNETEYLLILAGGKPKRTESDMEFMQRYEQIEQRAKSLGNVLRIGFVPENQIPILFSASDVLVLPHSQLLSASGPMAIALSYEKPFLASDVFAQTLPAQTIFRRTPQTFIQKLKQFFATTEQYVEISRKLKNERLWNTTAEKTFEVYYTLRLK